MNPDLMKHKASLWEGDFANSHHITDVYWEGDITQDELIEVADQISKDWQTIDLELDSAHPCHGQSFRLHKTWPSRTDEVNALRVLELEDQLEGQYVWVHCCQHIYDTAGELTDESGRSYREVFSTLMFCVEFTSFDDIAMQCDENFGPEEWDAYEVYADDDLPQPVAHYG